MQREILRLFFLIFGICLKFISLIIIYVFTVDWNMKLTDTEFIYFLFYFILFYFLFFR